MRLPGFGRSSQLSAASSNEAKKYRAKPPNDVAPLPLCPYCRLQEHRLSGRGYWPAGGDAEDAMTITTAAGCPLPVPSCAMPG